MNLIPPDSRRVINPNNPLFNQFPLNAVTAIDSQLTNNMARRANRASGIVIAPNHVLSAAHVGYSVNFNREYFALRATASNNEPNLNSPIIGMPGDPPANVIEHYYLADFPTTELNESIVEAVNDDIALFETSNTLLPASQAVGLISFVNPRSALGLTIETAGYPSDNVSSNISNNSGQQRRDLVLSPGDGSIGKVINIASQRNFFYSENVDTANGQSGSGIWHTLEGDQPRVIGVHSLGPSSDPFPVFPTLLNGGVLITKDIYDLIIDKIEEDFPGTENADLLPENAIIGSDPFVFLNGNDNIVGTYRRERIIGNGGNDKMEGAGADDRLDGGEGERDIAVFSDKFENYEYSISEDEKTITFDHTKGTQTDGKDTLENIEYAQFTDQEVNLGEATASNSGETAYSIRTIPLPLEDGVLDTESIKATDTTASPNPNDPPTPPYVSLTMPVEMLDGNVDYTLNISPYKPDLQYNILYIFDTSVSMNAGELQAAKDAYIDLTNYYINQGLAENINFGLVSFNNQAVLHTNSNSSHNLTADEAIAAIQNLTTATTSGTNYDAGLWQGVNFLTTSPLKPSFPTNPGGTTSISYFFSDGQNSSDRLTMLNTAKTLRRYSHVQAFGINNLSSIVANDINFIDSNNGVMMSSIADLSTELNRSGLAGKVSQVNILVDGVVVDTIQPNQLTDSPLGLTYEGTVDNLDVSLNAENVVTAEVVFNNDFATTAVDFTVTSGQGDGETTTSNAGDSDGDGIPDNGDPDLDPFKNILEGGDGNDSITLGYIDLGINGGAGDDSIVGNDLDNILDGGDGNDTIIAHGGNDTIVTGAGTDKVDAGEGIDTVVYADTLYGDSLINKLNNIVRVDNTDTLTNVEFIQYSDFRISTETLEITPFLQSEAVSVVEGDSGTTLAQFTFELSTAAPVNVQFDYTTVDGEAIAGEDYLATSGQVTIAPGQTTATVEVEIIGDTLQEPNESFALNLSGLSGATFDHLEPEYAVVANIENDDEPIILYGDEGNDTLIGEEQNDLLYGGAGNDSLIGNDGEDYLDGGANNDTLKGGNDDDFLDGGNDNDILYGDNGNDLVYGGAGNDSVRGNAGDDTLIGGEGNDTMFAHDGDDVLIGVNPDSNNPGENEIDYIKGDTDNNIFVLGDLSTAYYQNNGAADYAQINGFQIGLDTIQLHGSMGDYQLQTVGTQTNILYGDNNELIGKVHNVAGLNLANSEFEFLNDKLQMYGTEYDDTIIGGDSNQDLRGLAGNDLLYGGAGNDSVRGNAGDDTLIGGEGNDTMFAHEGDDVLIGVNPDSNNPGENEIDLIKGDTDSNVFVLGDETRAYYQDNGTSDYAQINGFQIGLDTIQLHGSMGDYQLQTVGTQTHILYGDNNELIGKVHNVAGLNLASSEFEFLNDKPQMYGTEYDDTIIGGDSNQDLQGGEGNDLVYGGAGNDSVRGNAGDDTLIGGEGNDTMFGHNGDDVLIGVDPDSNHPGENEIDLIKGDTDSNIFVLGDETRAYYQDNGTSDYAQINGFQIGLDTIELHGSLGDYQLQTVGGSTNILYGDNNSSFAQLRIGKDT